MKRCHLRYWPADAAAHGLTDPPETVMRDLGITYQHATPQEFTRQWWFWNCENVPDPLPLYLEVMEIDPMQCRAWGVDKETAMKIKEKARK